MEASLTSSFFMIFSGAAILASIALYTKQPLLIAYIALGAIIGPYGTGWVTDFKATCRNCRVWHHLFAVLTWLGYAAQVAVQHAQKSNRRRTA